jgi:putative iron-regulated protein
MRHHVASLAALGCLVTAGSGFAAAPDGTDKVLASYADLAAAMYADALSEAKLLDTALGALVATPSAETLQAARAAWLKARVPYMQTEVYRFGNPLVDEWEGKVNAWPLDEGLIDYVDAGYGTESDENPYYVANVIANPQLTVDGRPLDAGTIDAELLRSLHEVGTVEANVSTGYHAIEFLLWGQDLHGTEAGAGERPWTDFAKEGCTGGHCERRGAYLQATSKLMLDDLAEMAAAWAEGGAARAAVVEGKPEDGLRAMLTGLGSLSYGELAGERMKLGLLLHDPEEEHDCFADNTHNSHYYDIQGMVNVFHGRYQRVNGSVLDGPGLADVLAPEVAQPLQASLEATLAKAATMKAAADSGKMAYDQMLGEGNAEGNAMIQAVIDGLLAQTKQIEQAVASLELGSIAFEGSDSLDDPEAVFQ